MAEAQADSIGRQARGSSLRPLAAGHLYAEQMVASSLRAVWDEPRPADPPTRVWRDWVLLAVVLAGTALEVVLREERAGLAASAAVSIVIAGCLLLAAHPSPGRRHGRLRRVDRVRPRPDRHPRRCRAVQHRGSARIGLRAGALGKRPRGRAGAGRHPSLALAHHLADPTSLDEVVAGYGFFLFAAALGASVRFHANSRLREIEQAKLRLRNELARDLHDTVGHHVSGIAIQACCTDHGGWVRDRGVDVT